MGRTKQQTPEKAAARTLEKSLLMTLAHSPGEGGQVRVTEKVQKQPHLAAVTVEKGSWRLLSDSHSYEVRHLEKSTGLPQLSTSVKILLPHPPKNGGFCSLSNFQISQQFFSLANFYAEPYMEVNS